MWTGPNEARLRSLFESNAESRTLTALFTVGAVLGSLVGLGVDISPKEQERLKAELKNIKSEIVGRKETLIMGDFRSANIFVTSSDSIVGIESAPVILNVLDWEFATYGAAFIDLGHFAGESWIQDRVFHPGSTMGSVSRLVMSSLFKKYRQVGGVIDLKHVLTYMASLIVSYLVNEKLIFSDEERRAIAFEALQMLRTLEDGDLTRLQDDAFLNSMLYSL